MVDHRRIDNLKQLLCGSDAQDQHHSAHLKQHNHRAGTYHYSYTQCLPASVTMGLSTHILDTSRGKTAPNVAISLFRGTGGAGESWEKVGEGATDADGRYKGFFSDDPSAFTSGLYKLRFEVGSYYEKLQIDTLYPFVEIVFNIKDASQHYHIPLLLNPFGYSTYRGS